MEIFTEINKNPKLALALGYFDGVHLGHQAVIKSAVEYAKMQGQKSAVITFKDHPCCYFYGVAPKYILSREARRKHIEMLGVDYLYELDFKNFVSLSAEEYLRDILVKNFAPISISTGFNHNFGAQKTGSPEFLKKMSNAYSYVYLKKDEQKIDGETVSSTAIRNYLAEGNISAANTMLGYVFSITGAVVTGLQLGRKLGFRTANLIYPKELVQLPYGAYATRVNIFDKFYKAVTNIGIRPTVSDSKNCTIETHILNFSENIYGQIINIDFERQLRAEKKFNSVEELKTQIKQDIRDSI